MIHEKKHYDLYCMGIIYDCKKYPTNNIEEIAYKAQFKELKKRGCKNFNEVFKLIEKSYYDILKNYWENV